MAVYPNLDIERFIPVNRTSSAGITVSGYVSEVDYTAPTRSKQTIIVNGRVVENDTVSTAVDKAYREYLVKRTFPMYVLDIIVPFDEVDVNVHPAKSEVRFRNKNAVFGAVLRAVEEAIMGSFGQERFGFELKTLTQTPKNRISSRLNNPNMNKPRWILRRFTKMFTEIFPTTNPFQPTFRVIIPRIRPIFLFPKQQNAISAVSTFLRFRI